MHFSWQRRSFRVRGDLLSARSSYFYHCARQRKPDKYADARVAAADVFQSNHRSYGYRRMRAALGRRQLHLSERVVQRLMKQEGLIVPARKKRRYGSYLGEISPAPDNLLNRDFQAAAPNEKWLKMSLGSLSPIEYRESLGLIN